MDRYKLLMALQEATEDNPIKRTEWQKETNCTDMDFRKAIADLRDAGNRIVSHSNGKGYWLAKTWEEYEGWRQIEKAKLIKKEQRIKAMDNGSKQI